MPRHLINWELFAMYLRTALSYELSLNKLLASSLTRVKYYLSLDSNLFKNNSLSRLDGIETGDAVHFTHSQTF